MTTPTAAMPRPGCYGSPTCHNAVAALCARCPFQQSCGAIADRVAIGLRRKYGIDSLLGRTRPGRRPAVTRVDGGQMLPVRAEEHLQRLRLRGVDLPRALSMGVNPFDTTPPAFMRVAFGLLLKGAFKRAQLQAAFVEELGWSDSSALSHVSVAVSILVGAGAAVLCDGGVAPIELMVSMA